jgi:hypothetical protein
LPCFYFGEEITWVRCTTIWKKEIIRLFRQNRDWKWQCVDIINTLSKRYLTQNALINSVACQRKKRWNFTWNFLRMRKELLLLCKF